MNEVVSIAIETSCRAGGVALGVGEKLCGAAGFDAFGRHAVQLISHLDKLLHSAGLQPANVAQIYVSAGPGSFTGLRVGITVARTLTQMLPKARCVAVPTALAIAENAAALDWRHLGVLLSARQDQVYAAMFTRDGRRISPAGEPAVVAAGDFLARAPRPVTLTGEALEFHDLGGEGVTLADKSLWLPSPECIWRVGRRLAAAGEFTDYNRLLPIYARPPEALRLWAGRNTDKEQ